MNIIRLMIEACDAVTGFSMQVSNGAAGVEWIMLASHAGARLRIYRFVRVLDNVVGGAYGPEADIAVDAYNQHGEIKKSDLLTTTGVAYGLVVSK